MNKNSYIQLKKHRDKLEIEKRVNKCHIMAQV